MRPSKTGRPDGGFTLVEVVVALGILALTAVVLLERRVGLVREAARSREVRTAWLLAAHKLAELELDDKLWHEQGTASSGDFHEIDPAYASIAWEYGSVREQVPTNQNENEKPKEIFRVQLAVQSPGLDEPIRLEALFPVKNPPAAPAGPGGTPVPAAETDRPPAGRER